VITAYQEAIASADKISDDIVRRGGGTPSTSSIPKHNLLDHPWKTDDREWFEQNPSRSHRARPPFPGKADKQGLAAPTGHALILLVRQVEPGRRIKTGFYLNADLPPLPDDEATAHALFEVGAGREPTPRDWQALCTLIEKYTLESKQ
jgi:hypothetical protein